MVAHLERNTHWKKTHCQRESCESFYTEKLYTVFIPDKWLLKKNSPHTNAHIFLSIRTWLHSHLGVFWISPSKIATSFPYSRGAKEEFSGNNGLSKKNQLFTLHVIKQKLQEIFSALASSWMHCSASTLRFLFCSTGQQLTQSHSTVYQQLYHAYFLLSHAIRTNEHSERKKNEITLYCQALNKCKTKQ